ncbi:MAG: MarR family transcriptional regulator [Verrucomicrobiaceae bacterium]|nr:MarR family transcriptional regulator [Verrucomicrobiaceae bacterium]
MPKAQKMTVPSSKRAQLLKLDNQLCFALYALSNRITRLYQPLLAELGITYPQYLVLLVLWEHDARSVGELGRALDLDSGTLTPLLKRMESNGFVSRLRDADDERRVVVSLTTAGLKLREHALEIPGALACQIDLPLSELSALRIQLQHLRQTIE